MQKIALLLSLTLVLSTQAFAGGKHPEKNAPKGKKESQTRVRSRRDNLALAHKCMEAGDQIGAIQFLLKESGLEDTREGSILLGKNLMKLGFPDKALPYLAELASDESCTDPEIHVLYGKACLMQNDFARALQAFSQAADLGWPDAAELVKYKVECLNGLKYSAGSPVAKVENAGSGVNSLFPEFGMIRAPGQNAFAFVSRRPRAGQQLPTSTGFGIYDPAMILEDSYLTTQYQGDFTPAELASRNLISMRHDAMLHFTASGDTVYLYLDKNQGDLGMAVRKGKKWTRPRALDHGINTWGRETSLHISPDGNELVFVSNRGAGAGNNDLYLCHKTANGWSRPENMGYAVNTEYDEESPFFSHDGQTLYFASRGHNSMGGYDIFASERQPDGTWGEPRNLGFPLNSGADDCFFAETETGFTFSSARSGGFGGMDIYTGAFTSSQGEEPVVAAALATFDQTEDLYDPFSDDLEASFSDLSDEWPWDEEDDNYLNPDDDWPWNGEKRETTPTKSAYLVKGQVHYPSGSSTISESGRQELARVLRRMQDDPNLILELEGHCDGDGSDDLNSRLSYYRAVKVADYFYHRGIPGTRILVLYYGKSRPVASNSAESGKQENRRVEFRLYRSSAPSDISSEFVSGL